MTPSATPEATAAPKLLDQVRARIRVKHYSIRTETQYVHWIKRFILFHDKRHPRDMGAPEVDAFLTDLAVTGGVSASTQNQASSALLFLYREVPGRMAGAARRQGCYCITRC
ncbi:MAG: phage integrase N-terminal SAM-like domain-containing protein [Rhodocyclaceae bacterium]|nr:phage integrase N-terminal SAM-like domain-containing protein [Rhodocyclaceae bacterium]